MITLRDICLQLPYKDRLDLCVALRDSLEAERKGRTPKVRTRGEILLGMMEDIIAVPIDNRRTPMLSWARAMVAYQLVNEGYGVTETGTMIGRSHSSVSIMVDKVEWLLKFQKAIQDDIQRRTTQDIVRLGGILPDCGQCEMGEESR